MITKEDAKLTGRTPEFSLMSKGIGKDYISSNLSKWHKADTANRMYCNLSDGKKTAMPRYYQDKLYSTTEKESIKESNLKRQTTMAKSFNGDHRKAYISQQQYLLSTRTKLSSGSKKKKI